VKQTYAYILKHMLLIPENTHVRYKEGGLLVNWNVIRGVVIGGSRGGLKGLKPPLNFFRYVFWSMVPDTETSIGVIFCTAFR